MLALVHPIQHTPSADAPIRPPTSSSRSSRPARKPAVSSTSSSSVFSSRLSSVAQHYPTRQATAPVLTTTASTSTVPLKLNHVRSYSVTEDPQPPAPAPSHPLPKATLSTPPPAAPSFDIHSYPSNDLLRLLASLLTQIAAANDKLTPDLPTHNDLVCSPLGDLVSTERPPIWKTFTSASRVAISTPSSTLTFHARNIPTISLEAYLLRILKYCPTTNEVFLSLLVYFDRMAKLSHQATGRLFVIDSYNIHRLVIAGVTVASKFFSDVFYTNSRYAKVGGLPLHELNRLELQFLLLNDFRLVISSAEMQRYAEQLIAFSRNGVNGNVPVPPFPPTQTRPPPPTAPMQATAPIETYGRGVQMARNGTNDYRSEPPAQQGSIITRPMPAPQHRNSYPSYGTADFGNATTSGNNIAGHMPAAASNKTPSVRPRWSVFNEDLQQQQEEDGEDELETEAEGGAETDGGETTDDEPTIRPAYSSSSSEADNRSLCSTSTAESEDEDGEEIMEVGIVDGERVREQRHQVGRDADGDASRNDGDRTPERLGKPTHSVDMEDHRMASP